MVVRALLQKKRSLYTDQKNETKAMRLAILLLLEGKSTRNKILLEIKGSLDPKRNWESW